MTHVSACRTRFFSTSDKGDATHTLAPVSPLKPTGRKTDGFSQLGRVRGSNFCMASDFRLQARHRFSRRRWLSQPYSSPPLHAWSYKPSAFFSS